MPWYTLYAPDQNVALTIDPTIKAAMTTVLSSNNHACVFSMLDNAPGFGTTFYFSPEAEVVARMCKAQPCEKPSIDQVGVLLCGVYGARKRLYGR